MRSLGMCRKNIFMLTPVPKEVLQEIAGNLATAADALTKVLAAMPKDQDKIGCELASRRKWARNFLKFAAKLAGEQPEQLQLLREGVSVEQQIIDRQNAHRRNPSQDGEFDDEPKPKKKKRSAKS